MAVWFKGGCRNQDTDWTWESGTNRAVVSFWVYFTSSKGQDWKSSSYRFQPINGNINVQLQYRHPDDVTPPFVVDSAGNEDEVWQIQADIFLATEFSNQSERIRAQFRTQESTFSDDTWHHVCLTYNQNQEADSTGQINEGIVKVFVDGTSIPYYDVFSITALGGNGAVSNITSTEIKSTGVTTSTPQIQMPDRAFFDGISGDYGQLYAPEYGLDRMYLWQGNTYQQDTSWPSFFRNSDNSAKLIKDNYPLSEQPQVYFENATPNQFFTNLSDKADSANEWEQTVILTPDPDGLSFGDDCPPETLAGLETSLVQVDPASTAGTFTVPNILAGFALEGSTSISNTFTQTQSTNCFTGLFVDTLDITNSFSVPNIAAKNTIGIGFQGNYAEEFYAENGYVNIDYVEIDQSYVDNDYWFGGIPSQFENDTQFSLSVLAGFALDGSSTITSTATSDILGGIIHPGQASSSSTFTTAQTGTNTTNTDTTITNQFTVTPIGKNTIDFGTSYVRSDYVDDSYIDSSLNIQDLAGEFTTTTVGFVNPSGISSIQSGWVVNTIGGYLVSSGSVTSSGTATVNPRLIFNNNGIGVIYNGASDVSNAFTTTPIGKNTTNTDSSVDTQTSLSSLGGLLLTGDTDISSLITVPGTVSEVRPGGTASISTTFTVDDVVPDLTLGIGIGFSIDANVIASALGRVIGKADPYRVLTPKSETRINNITQETRQFALKSETRVLQAFGHQIKAVTTANTDRRD